MPEVRISGREDVISYWRELRSQYSNVITHYEFLEIGKRSIIKTIYGDLEMVVIVEILLDQYGKATRVINHLGTYVAEG